VPEARHLDWDDYGDDVAPDAYDRCTRPAERLPAPQREPERDLDWKRGEPTPQCMIDAFIKKGGTINRGEARAAKQKLNDERHNERQQRNGYLKQIVTEVVAAWDPLKYLERHRAIVRWILAKPRNRRRQDLTSLSTRAFRRQQTIRIVRAIAFDGLTQAEHCRRTGLDPAEASRMLADLCEEEPGLADTQKVISTCNHFVIWQKRQHKQMLHNKREQRTAKVLYGYDYSDVVDAGEWLPDYDAGSIRSIYSGNFKPCAMARDATAQRGHEDTPVLDLHEPETWRETQVPKHPLIFAGGRYRTEKLSVVLDWAAIEPMRKATRLTSLPDRYRSISRTVTIKNGGREVWRIARTLDHSRPMQGRFDNDILNAWRSWSSQIKVLDLPAQAPLPPQGIFGYRFTLDGPIHVLRKTRDLSTWVSLDIKTRDLPVARHENELRPGGVSCVLKA